MSYRITLNRPPIVECDTAEEVFALADYAMQRQVDLPAIEEDEPAVVESPRPVVAVKRGPAAKHIAAAPAEKPAKRGNTKSAAKAIRDLIERAGCARRISQICEALGYDEATVRGVVNTADYVAMGRGYYRLADAEPADAEDPEDAEIAAAVEEFEDPEPPSAPKPKPKLGRPPTIPDLPDRIRKAMAGHDTLHVQTIALQLSLSPGIVRTCLLNNPSLFEISADGGGWRLKR